MGKGTGVLNKINTCEWVCGTIERVESNKQLWNDAWFTTYKALGGQSADSGKKVAQKVQPARYMSLGGSK
jgi:hypothetical protein